MIKGCVLGAPPGLLGPDLERLILSKFWYSYGSVAAHSWIMSVDSFVKMPLRN